MAQEGYSRWLRDNSIPTAVEVSLAGGSRLKGILRIPRDRSLREMMNGGDPFIELDCEENGPTVVSKQSILSLRPFVLPPAEQLKKRLEFIDLIGAEKALGLTRVVSREELKISYRKLAALYHPDRYPRGKYPDEICDFVTSMTRKLYLAYVEVDAMLAEKEAAATAASAAASVAPELPGVRVA
jgi:hypothetical protein